MHQGDGWGLDHRDETGAGRACGIELRLAGIDAPELGNPFAEQAAHYLEEQVLHRIVLVDVRGSDGLNVVGDVYLEDATLVNEEVVRAGFAFWFKDRDPGNSTLEADQKIAAEAKAGMWSLVRPTPPWETRALASQEDDHWALWPPIGMPKLDVQEAAVDAGKQPKAAPAPPALSPARVMQLNQQIAQLQGDILMLEVEMKGAGRAHDKEIAAVDEQLGWDLIPSGKADLEQKRERLKSTFEREQKQRQGRLMNLRLQLESLEAQLPAQPTEEKEQNDSSPAS